MYSLEAMRVRIERAEHNTHWEEEQTSDYLDTYLLVSSLKTAASVSTISGRVSVIHSIFCS